MVVVTELVTTSQGRFAGKVADLCRLFPVCPQCSAARKSPAAITRGDTPTHQPGNGIEPIAIAFTALRIAQEEMPEATIRDIRFNQIEIQSNKYQTLQIALQTSNFFGRLFGCYAFFVWFQYIRTMGYSRLASVGHVLLLIFIPLVNLIVFLFMLHKERKLIREHSI